MFHDQSVLDLPGVYSRFFDLDLGAHDCWVFRGALRLQFQHPTRLREGKITQPWLPVFPRIGGLTLPMALQALLRPTPPGSVLLFARTCGTKIPLQALYTDEQLDDFSVHAPISWTAWRERNPAAKPDKVCLRCLNPNHAVLGKGRTPHEPEVEPTLGLPRLIRATGALLYADPPITTEDQLRAWSERTLSRSISDDEWAQFAPSLSDEVPPNLGRVLRERYGTPARRFEE